MKLVIGLFLLLLVIVVGGKFAADYFLGSITIPFINSSKKVTINNQTFKVTLAKSQKEKEVGLSSKTSLAQDEGMLFEFDKPDYYVFWMKDMKFPIDIIYIRDNTVVTVLSNVPVSKSTKESLSVYRPDDLANTVLEINAGLSEKYTIKKGDSVTIEK